MRLLVAITYNEKTPFITSPDITNNYNTKAKYNVSIICRNKVRKSRKKGDYLKIPRLEMTTKKKKKN